ncbi:hypothetical protein OHJ21_05095 [Virgibacillus sp. LDC1]|nr:hypothetical protein [Virgibacillus sp. LDC1]
MKLIQLLSIVVIIILSGCNADNNKTYHSSIPSSFFSDVEGKYYITAIGTTDEQNLEFQEVFDQNIRILSGYYQTGNPDDKELQMLNIDDVPKYIVFDTEKELYRTDNLNELNQFLSNQRTK